MPQLHIIDALGPFTGYSQATTINWSKVDFTSLEVNSRLPAARRRHIVAQFRRYFAQVASLGYDSISIDDLAHLVDFEFYSPQLRQLLGDYRALYGDIFLLAKQHNLKIFVNTDYLFLNSDIQAHLAATKTSPQDFFCQALQRAFTNFEHINGIILRIGENDGKDVTGNFLSHLLLKTPAQANQLLKKILPVFEQHHKTLIFRTWTLGVYPIGDLIWNAKTYDAVLDGITSNSLIISMKFGDTDFMRYLALNPLFFRGPHKKIIELQTRREWEGMGMLPSFVGWDYHNYLRQLATGHASLVGVHVWCQTGGWAKQAWANVTFLQDSSFWSELNTEVTISLVKNHCTVQTAIRQFCKAHGITNVKKFTELLELSETAIKKGVYIPGAARQSLYFRRSRLPTMGWLTWDTIPLPAPIVYFHQALAGPAEQAVRDADDAVQAAVRMVALARHVHLPQAALNSIHFMHDTLILFAQLRRYIFGLLNEHAVAELNKKIRNYARRYPQHYQIPKLTMRKRRKIPRPLLQLLVREASAYRKRDKIILGTSPAQARLVRLYLRATKSPLAKQAMGWDAFFR